MKVLTMCSAGVVRSVAMAHKLKHDFGIDAVALGLDTNSPETIAKMSDWADKIIVMQPRYADGIPEQFRYKLVPTQMTDVGPDIWLNPLSLELQKVISRITIDLVFNDYIKKG